MRNILTLFLLVASLIARETWQQVRVDLKSPSIIPVLQSAGIDLDHVYQKPGAWMEFALPYNQLNVLTDNGFTYEIIHADLEAFYASRLTTDATRDFGTGSMGGYYTLDEILFHLEELNMEYPHLISDIQTIGTTQEGRDIWAVKLSDNPNADEDEPEVLYTGLTHAREPMGYMNLFYFMYWICENYESDSQATALANNREMWFIPTVNPDGLVFNYNLNNDGGGMQRKNVLNTCSSDNQDGDWDGVDLNRNYGFNWGWDDEGSSPEGCSQTYRGDSAFSEPETQAVRNFILAHDFKLAFHYHAYGNLLIHPFGYEVGALPPEPDLSIFREFGEDMTQYNNYFMGTGMETVGYMVNGDALDWTYGSEGIICYTPEIGSYQDGFWPESDRILPLAEENLFPNQFLAWVAGSKYKAEIELPQGEFIQGGNYSLSMNVLNQGLGDSEGSVQVSVVGVGPIGLTYEDIIESLLSRETRVYSDIPFTIGTNAGNGSTALIQVSILDEVGYPFYYELTFTIGTATIIWQDDAEFGMSNWVADGWGLFPQGYNSGSCFADSPQGDYPNNWSTSTIQTVEPFDLNNVNGALLRYNTRWEIEEGWDWAQVLVSTGGNNWFPQSSPLMSGGTGNGTQVQGQFGYDGESDWVEDEIDLSSFVGESEVWVKFQLTSDSHVTADGIFIDNITLLVYDSSEYNLGDINNDSYFDILDVILLVNFILGAEPENSNQELAADMNLDGSLNILDVIMLVSTILESE